MNVPSVELHLGRQFDFLFNHFLNVCRAAGSTDPEGDTITMITGFDAFLLQRRRRRPASSPPLLHRLAGAPSSPLCVPIE